MLRAALVAALVAACGSSSLAQSGAAALTSDPGVEDYPTFSPDGRLLAYAASDTGDVFGGNWDIIVVDLASGSRRNLTEDHDGDDRFPSFSPNGTEILFWSDRDRGGYIATTLDGSDRQRIESSPTFASGPGVWSADGTSVQVIVRGDDGLFLETILRTGGGALRRIPLAGNSTRRFDLSGSRDGRTFAYVDGSSLTSHVTRIFLLDAESGESVPVTDGWSNDWSPSFAPDGSSLFFVSNRGGKKDVWRQPLERGRPSGPPVIVTRDVGVRHQALSPDGRRVAYSRGQTVANVWRVPWLSDRAARWDDAEPVTEGDAYIEFLSLSGDGKRLVTTSDASGNPDLWVVDVETGAERRLTNDPTPDWGPAWSPDDSDVAFYAYRSGNRDLWVLPSDGGPARRLTEHPLADMYPTWSPTGDALGFYSVRSGNRDLWLLPLDTGEPRQLTRHPGDDLFPHWSPKGDVLAFYSDRDGVSRIWAVSPDGTRARPLTSGPGRFPRFSRDGEKLLFTGWEERLGNVYELDLKSGRERAVTELSGKSGGLGSYALATDDRFIYFTWEQNIGDLYLLDLPGAGER